MPSSDVNQPDTQTRLGQLVAAIYGLKIRQVLFILTGATVLFYLLDFLGRQFPQSIFWVCAFLPFRALADACFTALIVGFTFEWLVRKETEEKLAEVFKRKLSESEKAVIRAIPTALLLRQDVQKELISRAKIEEIIRSCLQVQLGDDVMGDEIYDGLLSKTLSYDERWTNYRFVTTLMNIEDEDAPDALKGLYFDAIIDLRYETELRKTKFVFTCAKDMEEFNILLRNPDYEFRWLLPQSSLFKEANESNFQVLGISVDGIPLTITPRRSPDGVYEIVCEDPDLAEKLGTEVHVYYRVKTKLEKFGHLFYATVLYPTRNVVMEFDYAKADVHYVNVIDFFVSAKKPSIRYTPSRGRAHRIEVQLDEWVFPKGGAIFVWVLKDEYALERSLLQAGESRGGE